MSKVHTSLGYGPSVLALLCALATSACSEGGTPTQRDQDEARALGSLNLGLLLIDGSAVGEVQYVITRAGMTIDSGVLAIGADGIASKTITNLPVGSGYEVSLSSPRTLADGGTALPCEGSATFTVLEAQTTAVTVLLSCDDGSTGGAADINAGFNVCPKIGSVSATPTAVELGSSVAVLAAASDKDGDMVSFEWFTNEGVFANTASASYLCSSPGPKSLRLRVTDGPARGCTKELAAPLSVTCTGDIDGGPDEGDSGPDTGAADSGVDSGPPDTGVDSGLLDTGVPPVDPGVAPYLVPVAPGVIVKPFLTTGDSRNFKPDGVTPYRMVGAPDGLGAFNNGDGSFTLLSTHELVSTAGVARAHGAAGSFVSSWRVQLSDLTVTRGDDLIRTVQLWLPSTSAYHVETVAFNRFCSADLPAVSALYDTASSTGYNGRLFFNGEESAEGRAFAHSVVGDGKTWELPKLGKMSFENVVASPASGLKTVVVGLDDSTGGQVYVYVGNKTNSGTPIRQAGLVTGSLFGVRVTGVPSESDSVVIPTTPFTLFPLNNVELLTGAQLETQSVTAGITGFQRPEDGAFDPSNPNDFYFVTTASLTTNSRLWRLRFQNIRQPEMGGQISVVLDGTEGHKMLDNIGIDRRGHIVIGEDVGNDNRLGKVWRYNIATDVLTEIAQHNPDLFAPAAPGLLTINEEASGVIDASDLLGAGWWLIDVQAHYPIAGELVEGGQFLAIYDPGSL